MMEEESRRIRQIKMNEMQEKKSPDLPTSVLQRWTNLVAELGELDAKV